MEAASPMDSSRSFRLSISVDPPPLLGFAPMYAGRRLRIAAWLAAGSVVTPGVAAAVGAGEAGSPAWCAPEVKQVTDGVCHVDGGQRGDRRVLVVFLHGAIAKGTTWQWTQERALLRQSKEAHFEAIFPRAPLGPSGYVWPGSVKAQEEIEDELVGGWRAAQAELERQSGRPYDDVFVMGFSRGAYFASSLALRGKLGADGYAVFAGGAAYSPRPRPNAGDLAAAAPHATPVFVGVCADDGQTADDSRSLASALAARGWPHRVDEEPVGHMFSDVHVVHAMSYLRGAAERRRNTDR
jgi:predicted esterase